MVKIVKLIFITILLAFAVYAQLHAKKNYVLYSQKMLQKIHKEHGKQVSKRFVEWKKLIKDSQDKSEQEKLTIVNDFFNKRLRWVADKKLWKKNDYWATPMETLIKKAGDCEDFTIIKYFTLSALGVPINKLKLTYVKAIKLNQAHMVMTYSKSIRDIPLVLDNINKKILPATKRKDLKPVYSFNGEGLWVQKKASQKKAGSSSRIRLWVDLNDRMKKELI